jgi:CHAT domain-containing protein
MLLEADRRDGGNSQPTAGMLLLADPVYGRDDPRFQGQLNAMTRSRTSADAMVPPPSQDTRDADSGVPLARLAGTAREAALIASLLPSGQVDRLEGFAASKERFLQSHPERYRYIHIASHATVNAEVPELSALILSSYTAEGRPVDGKVLGADIMTLQLNADLVVLSACDTALGKNVAGEGLMGLRYVALARGARSVVSSLWEVPDVAAANLMDGFYRSLVRSKAPVDVALSQAMRGMITRGQSDPALWAAFTATVSDVAPRR